MNYIKKILFLSLSIAFLMSCASKRAAVVDSTIMEAKTLQAIAQAEGAAPSTLASSLIEEADKQNEERQTEAAYILADNAVLQLQISSLKKENELLEAENKTATDDLEASKESLNIYRNVLRESENAPKEQVIN